MTAPEGYTARLLRGMAEHLAGAGLAEWSPDAPYAAGVVGIYLRRVPAGPDRAVTLTAYPTGVDDTDLSDTTTGVQVRVRGAAGDTDGGDDLADAIYELLHGAELVDLAGIRASLIWRVSSGTLGPDALAGADSADRWERTDNYRVQAARLTPNRTD